MSMIAVREIRGNQYDKAFELYQLPVVATDLCTFRIPSSSDPGESDHLVRVDDPERPGAISCTCMAGQVGKPCWAMARALIAQEELLEANVWLFRSAASAQAGRAAAAGALAPLPLAARITDRGELALMKSSETPLAGMMLSIS